jgi:hypothetical protein
MAISEDFLVASINDDAILGMSFFSTRDCSLRFAQRSLRVQDKVLACTDRFGTPLVAKTQSMHKVSNRNDGPVLKDVTVAGTAKDLVEMQKTVGDVATIYDAVQNDTVIAPEVLRTSSWELRRLHEMRSNLRIRGDGVLEARVALHRPRWLAICPPTTRRAVIWETHCQAHVGIDKTRKTIQLRYFWPGMTAEIRRAVRKCKVCQVAKHGSASTSNNPLRLDIEKNSGCQGGAQVCPDRLAEFVQQFRPSTIPEEVPLRPVVRPQLRSVVVSVPRVDQAPPRIDPPATRPTYPRAATNMSADNRERSRSRENPDVSRNRHPERQCPLQNYRIPRMVDRFG